jgi:flagellar biosynthesis/type III secretory pathway chaperone
MAIATPGTTLTAEHQLLASLVELLQREQQVLMKADADGLAALMPSKTELVQQVAALSAERHARRANSGRACWN